MGAIGATTALRTVSGNVSAEELSKHAAVFVWDGNTYGKASVEAVTSSDVVVVEFDNGNRIECTADQYFLLSDRTYVKASEMVSGSVLLPWKTPLGGSDTVTMKKVRYVDVTEPLTMYKISTWPARMILCNGILIPDAATEG